MVCLGLRIICSDFIESETEVFVLVTSRLGLHPDLSLREHRSLWNDAHPKGRAFRAVACCVNRFGIVTA